MAIIRQRVETDRNTDITLAFLVAGEPVVHNQLTRVQVYLGTTLLDSATNPDLFDLSRPDSLTVKMGQAGLAKGLYPAKFYLFDSVNTLGKPWEDDVLMLEVV
ncbi:MAG: hypothetical protein PHU14_05740 [Methylovulum sp.]|nr:hypothetical protein [Methylovulum sp.]